MLRKIDCVLLPVENLEAAVAYYQDVFGLRLHWRNGLQVGLGLPETDAEIVLESGSALPAGASVHYLVDDVRAAVDYLAARGCSTLVAPFEIAIGRCAVVTDPFGNTLGLLDMSKGPLPQGLGLSPEQLPPMDTPNTNGSSPVEESSMRMRVEPVTLTGNVVRLEPLAVEHAAGLYEAGKDPSIWRYMPADPSASVASVTAWIEDALRAREAGTQLPFAIFERASGALIGSTRYLNISAPDHGLEIGWTWLTPRVQRTAVNTECKYLLLRHAFEEVGAIRMQIKTDGRNTVSQRAIERLGAVREGVLRKQLILPDGYQRDAVMYSIVDTEWPAVKARLEGFLART